MRQFSEFSFCQKFRKKTVRFFQPTKNVFPSKIPLSRGKFDVSSIPPFFIPQFFSVFAQNSQIWVFFVDQ
jgi:hypothetical protein